MTLVISVTCREADQQRAREYKKELQNMKARITVRPFLFEQVTQVNRYLLALIGYVVWLTGL